MSIKVLDSYTDPAFHREEGGCPLGEGEGGNGGRLGGWAANNPKYLDQFLMILLATFTTGLTFVRQLKQAVAILCIDQNYACLKNITLSGSKIYSSWTRSVFDIN